MGYDCPETYGDPAVLLPDLYFPNVTKKYKIGVVPHYCNLDEATSFFPSDGSVNIIDVRTEDVEFIIQELLKCEIILSSSLHGLILGHAYSIPSAQVEFTTSLGGDGVKFLDYFSAFGITPPNPIVIQKNPDVSTLLDYVKHYPQPNSQSLRSGLYKTCPFIKRN